MNINPSYRAAIEDFHRMRRRAGMQKIFKRFRKHASLLSYEDIRQQLRAVVKSGYRLKTIPLEAIQGSVGRYTDFTRDFLPTESINPQRWARVKAQFQALEGVPPIEVFTMVRSRCSRCSETRTRKHMGNSGSGLGGPEARRERSPMALEITPLGTRCGGEDRCQLVLN